MRNIRLRRAVAATCSIVLLASACGGGEGETETDPEATEDAPADDGEEAPEGGEDGEDAEAASGGEFSTYICEPASLTPTNSNETCGSNVVNALFSFLVTYDDETIEPQWGEEAPDAHAAEIETEDNQTYTITLKDGWTFHNGDPVTAQSYVDGWNFGALATNAQNNNYFFEVIEGYEALNPAPAEGEEEPPEPEAEELSGLEVIDETTFEVTLNGPQSNFPLRLGYNPFAAIPEALMEDPDAFDEAPIGNGAYQMDGEWQHDQAINVTKFEDYPGEPGNADAVEFQIFGEVQTAYTELQAGNLDVMDTIPPEQLGTAEQEFGERFISRPSSSYTYLGFPTYDERFADPDLRTAFSMAIDREAIIEAIFNGSFTPADAYVSPVVNGYREGACAENCTYDPEAAAALLEEAGGWEGTLTLWYNSGAGHDQWVEAAANQLRQNLGIEDIEFQSLQFAEYLELNDNEEFTGPFRLGWVMDYPSPENYLSPLHSCEGSSNGTGYCNEEVDDLLQQGNTAETPEDGIEFYNQAEDLIIEDMPHIPMWFGLEQGAHSENVDNVGFDPFTFIDIPAVTVNQ
jgi:ABC-type transport system substrate-binding protein